VAYHALGNWAKAVDDLTAALSHDPNHAWAGVYRADALMQLRRFDEAVEECRYIIKRDPGNQQALYVSGLALYRQAQSEPVQDQRRKLLEAAVDSLLTAKDIATKTNPPPADVCYQLASVLSELGRNDEAQKWYLAARNAPTSSVIAADPFAKFAGACWGNSVRSCRAKAAARSTLHPGMSTRNSSPPLRIA
jgi:tetratricopeptide (TPR) repeat protein